MIRTETTCCTYFATKTRRHEDTKKTSSREALCPGVFVADKQNLDSELRSNFLCVSVAINQIFTLL